MATDYSTGLRTSMVIGAFAYLAAAAIAWSCVPTQSQKPGET